MVRKRLIVIGFCGLLSACSPQAEEPAATDAPQGETPPAAASAEFVWPSAFQTVGNGYPNPGDPCRRLGESALTIDFLDDSAVLVGCPTDAPGSPSTPLISAGGSVVGTSDGVTMISIPQGDANAGMTIPGAST